MSFPVIERYILLSANTMRHIGMLVKQSKDTKASIKEEFAHAVANATDIRPKPEVKKPVAHGLPWEQIFKSYLAKYGEAQTALLLGMPERVIRCITEGSCIPSERLQRQIVLRYAKDSGLAYAEVASGKFKR